MGDVGPNFDAGATRIGRRRLPAALVAILDDRRTLQLALRELHAYAIAGSPFGRRGIVFRVNSAAEHQAILYKLQNLLGVENFGDNSSIYRVREGHWHLIDSEHIRHIYNRHGDAAAERGRGHLAIAIEDFDRLPDLIDARNICEFSVEGGMPRIKLQAQVHGSNAGAGSGDSHARGGHREDDVPGKIKAVGDIRLADERLSRLPYVRNEPACATTFNNIIVV